MSIELTRPCRLSATRNPIAQLGIITLIRPSNWSAEEARSNSSVWLAKNYFAQYTDIWYIANSFGSTYC